MKTLRRFFARLANFATRRRDEQRLREEIEEHIALQTADNIRSGLSSAEARLDQILECREKCFYKLHAFVLMPEHLHLLITPGEETSLEKAIMMIKGGSSFRIRKELNYKFPIWHSGYHDRWIRDVQEYRIRKQYIELNPAKAGLTDRVVDYFVGSASGKFQMDMCEFDGGNFSG